MIKNIISVIWTLLKFMCFKLIYGNRFKFTGIQRFSPNTEIVLEKNSFLSMEEKTRAHSGTRIRVRENARIDIGRDVAFNYNCMLTAKESISIGSGCEIGPGVLLYDHDHDIKGYSIKDGVYKTSPIEIGRNVWIGANVIILRGVKIGDNSVVAAGTVVRKGIYPNDSIIYMEKEIKVKSIK